MHGGKRNGAGRKAKAEEVELIERLSPMDDMAFSALRDGIKQKNPVYVKMFFEYRFGKPKEKIDVTSDGERIVGFDFIVPYEGNQTENKTNGKAVAGLAATNGNGQGH